MKKAASGKAKPAAKPRKAAPGHQLAQTFHEGTVLTDLMKSEWKLGHPIGSGGFGLLYLADRNTSGSVSDKASYVVKVVVAPKPVLSIIMGPLYNLLEPHTNGPLFCEIHFYQRAAKPDAICEWMSSQHIKTLGVPKFIACGNYELDGEKYRFLVMERFGTDLQKLFEANSKRFATHTVFLLGIRLLDILEYIHSKEYVHADIKASNLLTGWTDPHQVYLVDYGLAFRYTSDGKHKEYREDPKRAHDGTVEFTSRDAHRGVVPSRRGDLEILGYCMVQWLCGQLPWEDKLNDKNYVRDQKIKYMSDIAQFMKKCFPGATDIPVSQLTSFLRYVAELEFTEKPDYRRCKTLFIEALKLTGHRETEQLSFTSPTTPSGRKRPLEPKPKSSKAQLLDSEEDGPSPPKQQKPTKPAVGVSKLVKSAQSPLASASKSPAAKNSKSPAAKRASQARSPLAVVSKPVQSQVPQSTTPTKARSKPAAGRKRRRNVDLATIATQTSPNFALTNGLLK